MKTDLQDSPATSLPATPNGTHRAAKKPGPARRRVATLPEPLAAPFAVTEAAPIDAEMWPLHSAMWFQPERAPSASQWSGLAIERRNRLAAPAFAGLGAAPLNRPGAPEIARDPQMPDPHPEIPPSDLAPLGWDPRTICRKEEGE